MSSSRSGSSSGPGPRRVPGRVAFDRRLPFGSFSAAAQEVGQSRIYGGIHWPWDIQAGLTLGTKVGDYVASHVLLPVSKGHDGGDHADAVSGAPGSHRLAIG